MTGENERRPGVETGAAKSLAGRHLDNHKSTADLRRRTETVPLRLLAWCIDPDVSLVAHDEAETVCANCGRREAWTFRDCEVRCRACGHRASRWSVEGRVLRDAAACERLVRLVAEVSE